jgi:hypothetical protein
MTIELNKTYYKEIENFSFGELTKEELTELFKDGRTTSRFMEKLATKWFPELTNVDEKHYDHVDTEINRYEMKGFTKGGCNFVPSGMLGMGRRIDLNELAEVISEHKLTYIITDIVEFPKIRVRFVDGKELLKAYPKGKIKLNEREDFFGSERTLW